MRYAIIAAGEGSRLASEGIDVPKPLVRVCGEPLIDRLIRVFMDNDATDILVICNDLTTLVSSHLESLQRNGLHGRPVPLRFIVKSTPSSMHSFFELSKMLEDRGARREERGKDKGRETEPFVLTTVDTIFREEEFSRYVAAFAASEADGLMGVTDFIDDEKPLYVGTDAELNITGFYDELGVKEERGERREERESSKFKEPAPVYISGGIYGLTAPALATLRGCMERGESRMRNFQRALIRDGLRLVAWPFSKVLDIDHASDVEKAERFLEERGES